jgi:cold-inducible RNA-binding protein
VNNIYVGNLDSAATEETIRSLFAPHGKVERVKLMTDRHTGSFRGFAFVVMADSVEAGQAIQTLNGVTAGGRALMVREARPQLNMRRSASGDHAAAEF